MYPHHSRNRLLLSGLIALWVTTIVSPTSACRIPVFRYALEQWEPGVFDAILVHRQPLSAEQSALVDQLQQANEDVSLNLRVTTLLWIAQDENADERIASLTEQEKQIVETATEPVILLRFPRTARGPVLAWSGPLTASSVAALVDSPLRQQVVERLLQGDSAVWVLIESGDMSKDNAAAEMLTQELQRLEKSIQLPALEELALEEEFQANTTVPLRLGFSLLRLARDNDEESVLRSLLLASESDLNDYDEPIVIPIYGRGRTYFALLGNGINPGTIADNARFVCGDCSCQIKDQNPGVDVLLAVNWESKVQGTSLLDRDLPAVAGIGSLGNIDLGVLGEEPAPSVEDTTTAAVTTGVTPPTESLATESLAAHATITPVQPLDLPVTSKPRSATEATSAEAATQPLDAAVETEPDESVSIGGIIVASLVFLALIAGAGSVAVLSGKKEK